MGKLKAAIDKTLSFSVVRIDQKRLEKYDHQGKITLESRD